MSATFRILALAALLAVVSSQSFVQRIERQRAQSLKGLKGSNRADRLLARGHRNSRLKTGSQPFIDYYDDFYLGNITIGTPAKSAAFPWGPRLDQVLTVVLDTGSSNLWVIDCACRQQACKGDPSSGYTKKCYNPRPRRPTRQTEGRFSSSTEKAMSTALWAQTSWALVAMSST